MPDVCKRSLIGPSVVNWSARCSMFGGKIVAWLPEIIFSPNEKWRARACTEIGGCELTLYVHVFIHWSERKDRNTGRGIGGGVRSISEFKARLNVARFRSSSLKNSMSSYDHKSSNNLQNLSELYFDKEYYSLRLLFVNNSIL